MSKGSEIKQIIKNIATNNVGINLFEGEVTEAKDTTISAKIQGLTHENIRLVSGFANSTATMIVKPKVGSKVLIADLSAGKMRDLIVLMVEKAEVITFNGGENGGLIKIEELTKQINAIENQINDLKKAIKNWKPLAQDGGASLQTTALTEWLANEDLKTETKDLEDATIKH